MFFKFSSPQFGTLFVDPAYQYAQTPTPFYFFPSHLRLPLFPKAHLYDAQAESNGLVVSYPAVNRARKLQPVKSVKGQVKRDNKGKCRHRTQSLDGKCHGFYATPLYIRCTTRLAFVGHCGRRRELVLESNITKISQRRNTNMKIERLS